MKRHPPVLLSPFGFSGLFQPRIATPAEFTREFVAELRQAGPGMQVEVLADLELKLTPAEGGGSSAFLYNAYDIYKQHPKAKVEIIRKFVTASLETAGTANQPLDSTCIIPVIKDRPWIEEMRDSLLKRGATKTPEPVFEDFSPDLIIVYAEDSPKNIRYFTADDLAKAGIDRGGLRALACENLRRILPKIECQGGNGVYMITAGGDYEASLLLLDSIWSGGTIDVQGDIVVAIPTRDLLLVTGSQNLEGLEKLKQVVKKAFSEGSYRLTSKLFVHRGGQFEEFIHGN